MSKDLWIYKLVLTGTLSADHAALWQEFTALGFCVDDKVGDMTQAIIVGENPEQQVIHAAVVRGVDILSESTFRNLWKDATNPDERINMALNYSPERPAWVKTLINDKSVLF